MLYRYSAISFFGGEPIFKNHLTKYIIFGKWYIRGVNVMFSEQSDVVKIRKTAIEMHNYLRELSIREEHKPIFIAGVLIALNNDDFSKNYAGLPSYNAVMTAIQTAIVNELRVHSDCSAYIRQIFQILQGNTKFASIPLQEKRSILWFIEQIDTMIKPMMNSANSTLDALGVFYLEFIRYSGGDGSGLGIVLTPQHLTEFMVELAGVNPKSKVVDICCGSGGFLVAAMWKMFQTATPQEIATIKRESLYGVELDEGLYTLAITNMIIRQDGKSNIIKGDCFDNKIKQELKALRLDVGLINPPYSLKGGKTELEFVEQLLSVLAVGGKAVVVVPMSCALGTKFKEVRERLFAHHTLDAVFSMPDDIFHPVGASTCVMVWIAHKPHDPSRETYFGYCKQDGFVKRKKLGRVDYHGNWQGILASWLRHYHNRDVIDGLSVRATIGHSDEWLCEAHMKTDYSGISQVAFQKTINQYLLYLVRVSLDDSLYEYINGHPRNVHKMADNDSITTAIKTATVPLRHLEQWGEVCLSDIFTFENCKCNSASEMLTDGDDCYYLGAKKDDNGIMRSVAYDSELVTEGNCIVFICNGQGSVGYTNYMDRDFIGSTSLMVGRNSHLNRYIGMFLVTILDLERPKYSYGRSNRPRLASTIIKLPTTELGQPDWEYMEQYIKGLPYSDRLF